MRALPLDKTPAKKASTEPIPEIEESTAETKRRSKRLQEKDDKRKDNIVTKLKMQYENSVTGSQHSGDQGDVSEATNTNVEDSEGCLCTRSLRLVLCSLCGHTQAGRVSVMCSLHPRAVFTQDLVTCSACKRGGVTFLKEFDLPSGMEEALGGAGVEEVSR